MGKRRGFFSHIIDTRVDRWMSWDYISETTDRIKSSVGDLMTPEKPKYKETFQEAMIRLDLTEADIQQRKKEFTRLFYMFLLIGVCIIGYAVYMASQGYFGACLISFCLACYALTLAFKWHFWLFQIRNRKLGCTLKEWLNGTVIEPPPENKLSTTTNKKDIPSETRKR